MTKDEAQDLAMRIMQTWRNGPSAIIWEEILLPLHPRQAIVAYERLRLNTDGAPSIRQYMGTYHGLTARTDDNGPVFCQGCDGYGWISTSFTKHGIEYTASDACTYCHRGKEAKQTIDKINGARHGEAA